jgi:hypothetical protein
MKPLVQKIIKTPARVQLVFLKILKNFQQSQMIAVFMAELSLDIVGGSLRIVRAEKHVRHGQHGADGHNFLSTMEIRARN